MAKQQSKPALSGRTVTLVHKDGREAVVSRSIAGNKFVMERKAKQGWSLKKEPAGKPIGKPVETTEQ